MSTKEATSKIDESGCEGPENNCDDNNIVPEEISVPEEKASLPRVSGSKRKRDDASLDAVDIDKTKDPVVGGIWASGMGWLGPALRRVKVLPGLMFQNAVTPSGSDNATTGTATTAASTTSECPPEPLEAPPKPQDMVKLLVLGDAKSGKTSLINGFVYHHTADTSGEQEKAGSDAQEKSDEAETADWSFEYFKKDLAFCAPEETALRSVRAQLFDTTGSLGPGALGSKVLGWLSFNDTATRFKEVWKKADKILLVLSVDTSPDELFHKIQSWKKWVDDQEQQQSLGKKPLVLMLNKGDLLPKDVHPTFWISFARNMSKLCDKLEIESWHVTSSKLEDDATVGSIDLAFRSVLAALPGEEIVIVEEDEENEDVVRTKRAKIVNESDNAAKTSIPSPTAATTQEKTFEFSGSPPRDTAESNAAIAITP